MNLQREELHDQDKLLFTQYKIVSHGVIDELKSSKQLLDDKVK